MNKEKCWMVVNENNRIFIRNTTLDKGWRAVEALCKGRANFWTVKKQEVDGITYLNAGHKEMGDDGGYIAWYLFHKDDAPTDDGELLSRIGFMGYYSGPGGPFGQEGYIRRVGKRVLAMQHRGLDI